MLDLREEAIEITNVRDVCLHADHVSCDLFHCRCKLRIAASSNEDVGPFVDKLVRSGKPNPATSPRHKRNFSFELAHVSSPSGSHARDIPARRSHPIPSCRTYPNDTCTYAYLRVYAPNVKSWAKTPLKKIFLKPRN